MSKLSIPIEIELTPRSREIMNALAKVMNPERVSSDPVSDTAAVQPAHAKIGTMFHGGIYAGIARGRDGEPDMHLVLLADEPTERLTWQAAKDWAARIGARLPTRFESALLYANLQDQFDADAYYWTDTQYSADNAWTQVFDDGNQDDYGKSYEGRARAVRLIQL